MSNTIIVFTNYTPKVKKNIANILICTGANVNLVETEEEGIDALQKVPPQDSTVILVDTSTSSFSLKAKAINQDSQTILILEKKLEDALDEIADISVFDSIMAKNYETTVDARELISTVQKMIRKDIFGLEKYLSWGFEQYTAKICDSSARYKHMDQIEQFAIDASGRKPIGRFIVDLVDELLMNAIYDANPKYAETPRSEKIILEDHEAVTLSWGCDGEFFGVSTSDVFGRLKKDTIISYLKKCFSKGNDQIDQKAGGAGLGLYKIFKSLSFFSVNIEPNIKTEAIGILDLSFTVREFKQLKRSFHFFKK